MKFFNSSSTQAFFSPVGGAIFSLLFLGLLIFSQASIAVDKAQTAKVVFLRGDVSASDENATSLRQLSRGSQVAVGETVTTAAKAVAQLVFPDKSILLVKANSEVLIEAYRFEAKQPDADKSVIRVLKGGMRSLSGALGKRSADKVSYRTRFSTIGIRGTAIDVDEEGTGERVTFNIGFGWVGNASGRLDLAEGSSALVLRDTLPTSFEYQPPRDDPAFIARTLALLPTDRVPAWLAQNSKLLSEGSAMMLLGMQNQQPNRAALTRATLGGLQKILPPAAFSRVLGTATGLRPRQSSSLMRDSVKRGMPVKQALLATLSGLSNSPKETINQVIQASADLGITPEQAQEVIKELSEQSSCQ